MAIQTPIFSCRMAAIAVLLVLAIVVAPAMAEPMLPVANFTATPLTGPYPLTVQFTDLSTGDSLPTAWAWDFNNDGIVDNTTQSPSYVYNTAGNFTVSLTVTNATESDDEVKTDYITVASPVPVLLWGPYLTGTTTTATVVNAKTEIATTVTVEYATDAYYTAQGAFDQSATDGVSTQLHHVPLATLTSDTLYHYRVVYDGQATGDLHFRTFPKSGAFTFVVYSDTQDQLPTFSQLERHKLVADRIAQEPDVAFVLNSGDLVNNAANLSDWNRYFAAGSMMMANTTVFPALGNHDANNTNYYQNYGVSEYYSFDCADAHVAVLDSNDWAWPDLPVQSAWLANDLQTEKKFKFVSFHHPLYTSDSKHFGGWENLREEWEDDFNDNGVLAVFNGHVHAYERFLVNDTNYFVAGIGGAPSYNLATPRYTGSLNSLEYMIGYIKVTIDPVARTATAQVIRVADVSPDLKSLTTVYPVGTVFETVVMSLAELPVSNFTATPLTGPYPLTVQFTDTSLNDPTSWVWEFGDGGTSTMQSPPHVYNTAGNFTVNLTATNGVGSNKTMKTGLINVTVPPSPALSFVPNTTALTVGSTAQYQLLVNTLPAGLAGYNLTVSLDNPSIGTITAISMPFWSVLGSTTFPADSITFDAVDLHRLVEPGATNVVLATIAIRGDTSGATGINIIVNKMDADGGDMIVPGVKNGELVVYQPLVANFTASPIEGPIPLVVNFTDTSTGNPAPTSWSWDFNGDGLIDSTAQSPQYNFTMVGNYTVNLTVSNTYGEDTETKISYIMVRQIVVPFPGCILLPTDPDGDRIYEDINGNGRLDFDDVVIFYQNMAWVTANTEVGVAPYDLNGNGRIDFDDVVLLYYDVLGH